MEAPSTERLPDEQEFCAKVRAFLEVHAPRAERDGGTGFPRPRSEENPRNVPAAKAYQRALFDAGLAGLTWPVEYGGQGLPVRYQILFNEEAAGYALPSGVYAVGLGMCIPTILALGTEEQKERYVRPATRGEEIWSLFLSEPGAGSDLAGLQTKAVRDGDVWRVNGQKVWTSGAHFSEFGILLARTDPDVPKHKGLTMFVVEIPSDGMTIRPLRQMTGEANFNEVFFDDVELPGDAVLGEVDEGWRSVITTLMHERMSVGSDATGERKSPLEPIMAHATLARAQGINDDPKVRRELVQLYIKARVLDFVTLRARERREPGPEGSIIKLSKAMLSVDAGNLAIELGGMGAVAWGGDTSGVDGAALTFAALNSHAVSIGGGTNNIQRNILAERILGLPKEAAADKDVPFRDLKVGTVR